MVRSFYRSLLRQFIHRLACSLLLSLVTSSVHPLTGLFGLTRRLFNLTFQTTVIIRVSRIKQMLEPLQAHDVTDELLRFCLLLSCSRGVKSAWKDCHRLHGRISTVCCTALIDRRITLFKTAISHFQASRHKRS